MAWRVPAPLPTLFSPLALAAAMLPNWAFLPVSRLAVVVSTCTGACMMAWMQGRGEEGEGKGASPQ